MLDRFTKHITRQHLFDHSQEVLLAVSGGADSSVMCHLMHRAGYRFAIAHCNFNLRAGDCDRDALFVQRMAQTYGVPFYTESYDTHAYATREHLSIEEAARNLRYNFFERLRQQHGFAAVATAHHRDDSAETFFINLMRGTGISGLCGIPCRSGHVVRPMLCFSRADILSYADANGIDFVTDYTNSQPDYLRNRIRLEVMPLLRTLAPAIDQTMQRTMQHLADTNSIYRNHIEGLRGRLLQPTAHGFAMAIDDARHLQPRTTLLYELLQPFGFNAAAVADIEAALDAQPGKLFVSASHRLLRDRTHLLIEPLGAQWPEPQLAVEPADPASLTPECLRRSPLTAYFDADRLRLPLSLRPWHEADRFAPLGMKGSRLVSDMLTGLGLSLFDKERARLLCDADGQILWLVGLRTAHRVRIANHTTHAIKVTVQTAGDTP